MKSGARLPLEGVVVLDDGSLQNEFERLGTQMTTTDTLLVVLQGHDNCFSSNEGTISYSKSQINQLT